MCIRDRYQRRVHGDNTNLNMTTYDYLIPANNSDYIHFPRTLGGSFDVNAIDPGMINHRLSRDDINYIIGRANETSNGVVCKVLSFIFGWIITFVVGLMCYIYVMERSRYITFAIVGWIVFLFLWAFSLVFGMIRLSQNSRNKLQKVLDEENELRLHSRGLHLMVGPYNRYLTLHLNYSPAPVISTFPQQHHQYVITQPTNQMNQPFLVPAPRYA
eukprot:TRINITY_DN9465_c0_g2_i2.p1 TRINITY_DN9465_c0_g2~~TRINITY_DN9465_c0_g2_i2.p1  ORF type:complete len:215 (-),score=36.15 TRINITY_DN9465_c0_g2_i2:75-719(-)